MHSPHSGGAPAPTSEYYSITRHLPLASRLSFAARRKMFQRFVDALSPTEATTVLDLGVTCDANSPESNYFEQLYPHKHRIVCAGTEPAQHLGNLVLQHADSVGLSADCAVVGVECVAVAASQTDRAAY